MRLTAYSDYALRLLMYVALRKDSLATIQDVAEAYGISKNHLMKVAFDLGRQGLLETVRGRGGGLRLACPPEEIRLGELLRQTEDGFKTVECFDPERNACVITGSCRLRGILGEAMAAYLKVLDRYTLADLTARNTALARQLLDA
ncbi:MAG TPA: Rrf2 family transcriptional regulator [Rhizomicrobium sp.]|jgi:Rrf2 family nitric oxide-sensitive transcriptional repressor|nr:Rrf2 family transcriptional regulator [Rhizomicrobium sp.]